MLLTNTVSHGAVHVKVRACTGCTGAHVAAGLRCTSHVTRNRGTRHTSHVTRHTSHVTRHTSHVTRHTSHVTRHTSHVTRHTSHVTCRTAGSPGCSAWDLPWNIQTAQACTIHPLTLPLLFRIKSCPCSYPFDSGGHQGSRGGRRGQEFFIENVMEELDAPGE